MLNVRPPSICHGGAEYFSNSENVFVQIRKCICPNQKSIFPNQKMYSSKLDNVFLHITIYIAKMPAKRTVFSSHYWRSFLLKAQFVWWRVNLGSTSLCEKCLCGRLRYVICNLLAAESSASVDSHIVWTPVLMPRGQAKNEAAVEFKWKCLSGMTIWTVLDVGRCPDMQNLPTGIQSRIQVNANPHFCLIGSTVALGL